MLSVLETCIPRPEIVSGTFNPEVFTVSLSPIIEYYRNGSSAIDSIYTNAELFFEEATFPTQGLRQALSEIFSRIAGDMTVPAVHRLETAFGGGKTHTLIACTHIAKRGSGIQESIHTFIDTRILPEQGSVCVVGIAGDEIPVHRPKGGELVPYTLWGEIAYQIGGEKLYLEVEEDAQSQAAPGKPYFDKVFKDKKVLIMLDELAQYAARLEAARPDGAGQLAAFLMSLIGYARNHSGIAIVLTLASAADAFSRQSSQLAALLSDVRGQEMSEDAALDIGEKAVKGVASVVARDAVQITPVQASEISSVFAKRLFINIDRNAAQISADEYMQMYQRTKNLLPDEATNNNMTNRMIANYPFHPTLVDYLTRKLTSAENFQGTRGVLRVLSLAVRNLWQNQLAVPMIHVCHIDMRSPRVVNELLNRTGSSNLMYVLNADVGSVDTETLEGGYSNAQLADLRNPHPEGYPLYEYVWKTVFLHSLVGSSDGLNSKVYGINESEAMFQCAFPGMTPPQVRTALEEIQESAFYIRYEQGKYFASIEPTINSILARIRSTIDANQVQELLQISASNIINGKAGFFHIENEISLPEHLPDGKGRPMLGVVSLNAEKIDVEAMVTTRGDNRAREQQNLIFLLVPETVSVREGNDQEGLFSNQHTKALEARQHIEGIARQVKAMRILADKPQSYGVNPRRLDESDFKKRKSEREQALNTAIAGIYTSLFYPSTNGSIVRKEIKTAGGEGGTPFIELIRELLISDGELLTSVNTTQSDLIQLSQLFFEQGDTISLEQLRKNFNCIRKWPIVESDGILEPIVRSGVLKGIWCVFRMDEENREKPAEFYHGTNMPLGIKLNETPYEIVTLQGAKQRGWTETKKIDTQQLRQNVSFAVQNKGAVMIQEIAETKGGQFGESPNQELDDVVNTLVKNDNLFVFRGKADQTVKPDLISGPRAVLYNPQPDDVLISKDEAKRRGWIEDDSVAFKLSGKEDAVKFLSILRRLGSIYNHGAKSTINDLDLVDMELPDGGTLQLRLYNVSPDSMKALGEFFEVLDRIVKKSESTEVFLEITNPEEDCLLIQELNKKRCEEDQHDK